MKTKTTETRHTKYYFNYETIAKAVELKPETVRRKSTSAVADWYFTDETLRSLASGSPRNHRYRGLLDCNDMGSVTAYLAHFGSTEVRSEILLAALSSKKILDYHPSDLVSVACFIASNATKRTRQLIVRMAMIDGRNR